MQKRGQLTVEFIFVIVYFVMLFSIVFTISSNFIDRQAEIHLRNQETRIANSLSKILSASKGFEDGSTFEIKYRIPKIYVLGKDAPMPCDILIDAPGGKIRVSADYKGTLIIKEIDYAGTLSLNTKCGKEITIT